MLWIYDIPTPLLGLLFAIIFGLFGGGGALITHRALHRRVSGEDDIADDEERSEHNERVVFLIEVVGVFYILLLGMTLVAAYERYAEVKGDVAVEAASLAVLYGDVSDLNPPVGDELKSVLVDYTRYTIEEEWPLQRQGTVSEEGAEKLASVQKTLVTYEPGPVGQQILQASALSALNEYDTHRRLRLHAAETGLPAALYYVIVLGAVITVALSWMFSTRAASTRLLVSGLLSLSIGLLVFITVSLDYPLRGTVSIDAHSFERVLHDVMGADAPRGAALGPMVDPRRGTRDAALANRSSGPNESARWGRGPG